MSQIVMSQNGKLAIIINPFKFKKHFAVEKYICTYKQQKHTHSLIYYSHCSSSCQVKKKYIFVIGACSMRDKEDISCFQLLNVYKMLTFKMQLTAQFLTCKNFGFVLVIHLAFLNILHNKSCKYLGYLLKTLAYFMYIQVNKCVHSPST